MKSSMRYADSHPPALSSDEHEQLPPGQLHLTTSRPRPSRSRELPLRFTLRVAAGFTFFLLGSMKFFDSILLGTEAISLPDGPAGFAQYLAAIGVPLPLLSAYLVCLVEILCGLGLLLSVFLPAPALLTRLCALPLFMDMTVATLTVGLRNLLGDPVRMEGIAVTTQAWRLPLEVALLVTALLFLWRPLPRSASA
jgi:putative oxidoreductase